MKYNIAFFCNSVPLSAETIQLQKSLGGSETALIYMANALADRGHSVTVFTQMTDQDQQGFYNNVKWVDLEGMAGACQAIEWDVFISQRHPSVLEKPIRAKYRALWVQDVLMPYSKAALTSTLWQTDQIYYVSEWHCDNYENLLPDGADRLRFVTKNGIDLATVDANTDEDNRNTGQLIYISRPERGLFPLLQIFPQIKAQRPWLELKVCRYYSMYENNAEVKQICQQADRMVAQTEGVEYLGNLNKADLYRAISQSALMVYPGVPDFDETSCIAALEAQACRTPLVASRKGGLIETLAHGAGALIGGDAYSDGYQQEFINQTFDLLDDPERYTQAQQVGRDWVESQYQYKTIATEWEKNLDLFFETRFNTYKSQIFDNLLHHDDFATAHHIVEHKEIKEAQALDLYGALSQDHTEEDYDVMMLDPEEEEQAVEDGRHFRLETVLQLLDPKRSGLEPKSILDYGCGGGIFASALQRMFPKANVLGLDFSGGIVDKGNQFIRSQEWNDSKVPLILEADLVNQGTLQEVKSDGETYMSPEQKFDLILVGELLEHYIEPMELISALDDVLAEGGTICWTVPNGPFVELADTERERTERTHRIHWEYNTVKEVFGGKADFDIRYICINNSTGIRGLDKGHYVFSHKKEGQYGEINFDKKYKLTRPYQKVSACLIARNNEKDIARCLDSIHQVADEIIIADNGSTDSTLEIAEKYGAKIINLPEKWPQAPEWAPAPGNFSWMRNESVKPATGDWILWIDTDEELRNGHLLGQYLQSRLFDGFVLRQNHLMVDVDTKSHDTPVRVYRADQGFEFYGCIHEHAHKSLNQPIEPSLELDKTDIIHYGYVTEDIRRYKCMTRNMMLMKLDRAVHPGRLLGWCLLAREYLNLASWEKQDDPRAPFSQMTERRLREVVRIFHDPDLDLSNPEGRYYKIIFPLYQSALKCLDAGIPVEVDVKVSQNGQGFRFLDQEDLERHLNFNLHGMTSKLPPQGRNKTYLTQVEG